MTEIVEWNYWPLVDHELEGSDATLRVEVRIWSEQGEMNAEPLYYALYSRDDDLVMDGAKASAEFDRVWRLVAHLVSETYDGKRLAKIQAEHPAFEDDGKIVNLQKRLDAEWARSVQL